MRKDVAHKACVRDSARTQRRRHRHPSGTQRGQQSAHKAHHQLRPPNTLFEKPYATLDPAVREALVARGYRFENQGWNGDIQVVVVGRGGASAVSDPRGRGVARALAPAGD